MSHQIIEVNNVGFIYPDGQHAVNEVSFSVHHGESIGIVGANGAGKSTLLMLLLGVLFPVKGNIEIGAIPVSKKTLGLIRQKVGMVFQDPDDQLFMPTVYEDVAFGPRNYNLEEGEVDKRVLKALETVGISHLKDRAPYKLSGGEKRAAAIASVLAMHPDILIMDEPSAALDPKSRRRLIKLLQGFDHTKLIASHDLDMIFELCERTIILKDGVVMADGQTVEVLLDEALMAVCSLEIPLSVQKCPRCGAKAIKVLNE